MQTETQENIIVTPMPEKPAAQAEVETELEAENDELEAAPESESEQGENEDESEESATTEEGKHKKNGFKKRFDRLKRREMEAKKEVEYWKREALKGNNQPKSEPTPRAAISGKPKADDFNTHEDFVEALSDWKFTEKLKDYDKSKQQEKVQATQKEKLTSWQSKVESYKESNPDFEETMEEAEDVILPYGAEEAIMDSEFGPKILHELAKNPELAIKISKLSAASAIREIGKIEARLEDKTTKQTTSKAPKPITSVRGGAKITKSLSDPNLTQAEYEAIRAKQSAGRAG
jgi:hypothetical protein